MRKRVVVAFLADIHANSRFGLLNPDTVLERDDRGVVSTWKPQPTPDQIALWDWYMSDLEALRAFVGRDGLIVVVAGDITDGFKHPSDHVSARVDDQVLIAAKVLMPISQMFARNLLGLYLVKGTEAHEMLAGALSVLTGEVLRRVSSVEVYSHPKIVISGDRQQAIIDVAHHGPPPGKRVWLQGNEVRYYVRDIVTRHLVNGQQPPDAVVRAHQHVYTVNITEVQTVSKTYFTLGMILPPYSLITPYARQAASSPQESRVGLVALEVVDGELNLHPWEVFHPFDLRVERRVEG